MGNIFEDKKKEPIVPLYVPENGKVAMEPLKFIDKDINGQTSFAILKSTEGGKYIRGNYLYYSFNGVDIYTELNNIIFVDTTNHSLFIRDYDKVNKNVSPSDPETKEYIILYTDLGYEDQDEGFPLRWESVTGRMTCYENIKSNISVIDIDKSLVLVDTVAVKDSLTVREFIEYLQNADIVDKEIDLEDISLGSEYL